MSQQYACQQPAGVKNSINYIAVVGAGGTIGSYITQSLVRQGKHKVTALTRPDSNSDLPQGLAESRKVDYRDHAGLVKAMKDQDALIVTMSISAAPDTQNKLIDAAVGAEVKYVMLNEYGGDYSDDSIARDTVIGVRAVEVRRYLEKVSTGKTHWLALTSSFWYGHSLAGGEKSYGFDFDRKSLTVIDDGKTKICTSSYQQSGEAVAKLFAFKILPENQNDTSLTLSQFNNKPVYMTSFVVSQRDMFESVLRVTGDRERDWTISHEDSQKRYQDALEKFQDGDMMSLITTMYTRVFFPNGGGDYSDRLMNEKLGLQQEDLDDNTKFGVKLHRDGVMEARRKARSATSHSA